MCEAIEFQGKQAWFRLEDTRLPIWRRDGALAWLPWGMRNSERHVHLFNGGHVGVHRLEEPGWQALRPIPVRLAVERFALLDKQGVVHWFDVPPDQVMRGVLARWGNDARVYIVTDSRNVGQHGIRSKWPMFRLAQRIESKL